MAKLETTINFAGVEPVKSLIDLLVMHIDELPEPVVEAMQAIAADTASCGEKPEIKAGDNQ